MKNVLIVDDDVVFLEIIVETMKQYSSNFNVITAENGQGAKEIMEKEKISLLVTDIMMPEVDGLALLAYVNDRNYSFPCFIMSAYGTPEIRKLIPKDVLHFFSKPFPANKLASAIESELKKGSRENVVSGISIASFLLLVEMDKKTCLFEVILPGKEKGLFYFNKGVLFNAVFKEMNGEEAVLSLLQAEKAKFRFKKLPDKKLAKRVDKDLATLIQEAKSSTMEKSPDAGAKQNARLSLPGSYRTVDGRNIGEMIVMNMSVTHILIKTNEKQMIPKESQMEIVFRLDDKPKSIINKDIKVLEEVDGCMRCVFIKPEHYDRLGPYLHFNYLDKQQL